MKLIKNVLGVLASNIITIIAGIFVSFLLPKMLSIEGYGLYKKFTLYSNYLGICSMGIIDGIVLRYGGNDYDHLEKEKLRSYFSWYMIAIGAFALIIAVFLPFFVAEEYCFIVLMLAVYLIAMNITGYFQQISQITQRFREYSLRKILQSLSTVLIITPLFISFCQGNDVSYKSYVVLLMVVNYALTLWYVYTYRDIVFGERKPLKNTWQEIIELCQKGFPLLFANLCSTLILSLDRQFVSILFTTEEYATYAFAYSMLSMVTVATSAISTVIFPMMKRMSISSLKENYSTMLGIVVCIVFAICIGYFPLCIFIEWFLPKYAESLVIFRIILPGIAVTSAITVIMHNYYKVFDKTLDYFKKSVIILLISGLFNYVAFKLAGTREAISIASIMTMLIWYFMAGRKLEKEFFCKKNSINTVYMLLMMVVFYVCTFWIVSYYIGCAVYLAAFIVITLFFQSNHIRAFVSVRKR